MNILVTGGTGFIGTHLVNELVRRFPQAGIDIVDDLSGSTVSPERKKFFAHKKINFYRQKVENFRPGRKYDQIYHLASPVGPAAVLKYAGRMGMTILVDSIRMADLALKDRARLLCVSTSEVYGPTPTTRRRGQRESINKVVPAQITVRLEYGTGKLLSEIALINLAKVKPLKVNFIRPFNIIGPLQNAEAGFVVPRFVDSALKNEPLTVFGTGKQVRSFTHVADIVDAVILIMNSAVSGRIYNIGNPTNVYSIKKLAEIIVRLAKSKSKINLVDPTTIYGPLYSEAWNKIPDISLIKSELNWEPKHALIDILKEYVDFCRTSKLE